MKLLLKNCLLALCLLSFSSATFAQNAAAPTSSASSGGSPGVVSTLVTGTLVGGILGLSTISFYSKPEDHLINVPLGAAVGAVIGLVYVGYNKVSNISEVSPDSPQKVAEPSYLITPSVDPEYVALGYYQSF